MAAFGLNHRRVGSTEKMGEGESRIITERSEHCPLNELDKDIFSASWTIVGFCSGRLEMQSAGPLDRSADRTEFCGIIWSPSVFLADRRRTGFPFCQPGQHRLYSAAYPVGTGSAVLRRGSVLGAGRSEEHTSELQSIKHV